MREASEEAPLQRERNEAYAAGRLARRTGKSKDANPWTRGAGNRTTRTDWLRGAWDAGYDFEVC